MNAIPRTMFALAFGDIYRTRLSGVMPLIVSIAIAAVSAFEIAEEKATSTTEGRQPSSFL